MNLDFRHSVFRSPLYLIFGEYPEDVNFSIGCKPEALGARGDNPRDEGAVAQLIIQGLLIRPVRSFTDLPKVRMIFGQP